MEKQETPVRWAVTPLTQEAMRMIMEWEKIRSKTAKEVQDASAGR